MANYKLENHDKTQGKKHICFWTQIIRVSTLWSKVWCTLGHIRLQPSSLLLKKMGIKREEMFAHFHQLMQFYVFLVYLFRGKHCCFWSALPQIVPFLRLFSLFFRWFSRFSFWQRCYALPRHTKLQSLFPEYPPVRYALSSDLDLANY